jgi:hypothetical protein
MKTSLRSVGYLGSLSLALVVGSSVALGQTPATPGPEHAELKHMEGEWIATIKTPGGDSKGTSTFRMECGGLWLVSDFNADFGGQKFQGRGFDGYDPEKKKYVSVWVDSMSARPMLFEGERDKEKKSLTMVAEGPGPDGKPTKFKSVSQRIDADHEVFKMYIVGPDGKDMEMMTIEYARKK